MPRSADRGGPATRARIAGTASRLFSERGFDAVTVADVAREAGVSSVTVFNHFPKKEDLYLDRSEEAVDLVRAAVRDREPGTDVVDGLRRMTLALLEQGHPLSGTDPRSAAFFRTIAQSATLTARARQLAAGLQEALRQELEGDAAFDGDPQLLAAFFVSGYAALMTAAGSRMMEGQPVGDQRARLERLFAALRDGVLPGR